MVVQVTPKGQRTMRTSLSASKELTSVAQLPGNWLDGCVWLHCEGYCLYRPEFVREAMRAAKKQGAQVETLPIEMIEHIECGGRAVEVSGKSWPRLPGYNSVMVLSNANTLTVTSGMNCNRYFYCECSPPHHLLRNIAMALGSGSQIKYLCTQRLA